MAGDWKITADERTRFDMYFQQCGPVQGYLTGEQARDFFVKSTLPGDILRKIWDLADVTADGRLDKREFAIACCLISSQVQKKGPLPSTLPPSLLSDPGITTNGMPSTVNVSGPSPPTIQSPGYISKPAGPANTSLGPIAAAERGNYLRQFHALVDVTKTNGFMAGSQAKNVLVQTGLSNHLLHQIWNLADYDKDGRLTAEEYIVAMHCCDIARTGQPLPVSLPDAWLPTNPAQEERKNSLSKTNEAPTYADLNQQLKETVQSSNSSAETSEAERKLIAATYEEKRLRNYEDGNRELERRRQLLRDQEEQERREREEREHKRDMEIQRQKEELERKKQMEIDRQLEKQRQIEQQKEEERKKLYEQREAARKEMERKSRLEWEHQRMLELSTQKSRLSEQINDLKSRGKAFELELENMDDTLQAYQTKITQTEGNIHTIDESIAEVQRNINTEKEQFDSSERQKKEYLAQLSKTQAERESLDASLNELNQSKELNNGSRVLEQMKNFQSQIESMTQESAQIDEELSTTTGQCQDFQNQIEQLRVQFEQLEKEAKEKIPPDNQATSPVNPPAEFANFEQFNANTASSNEINNQSSDDASSSLPASTAPTSSSPTIEADPFQTVDPFASQPDINATAANANWFQAANSPTPTATVDPFLPKPEPTETPPATASPRTKKAAPKANPNLKKAPAADPWGGSSNTNNGGSDWAQFDQTKASASFGATTEWPQTATTGIQYRILYDYASERPDELSVSSGDIVTVDPSKQQDEHWLFGQIGHDRQGFFPTAYAEPITTSTSANDTTDTTSPLPSGSWAIALAECQGKTPDKHLSFQKGELILVREQKDATWYSGQLHGKIGWFPRNHIRPATEVEIEAEKNSIKNTPTSPPVEASHEGEDEIFEAIYPYEATDTSDLSFDIGERITVIKRDGDWWTGRIGDRVGTFPNNYVQKIGHISEVAIATTSYQATEDNHLSFEQGQTIYIINKDEKGLLQGEIRLPDQAVRAGWFPANCVQMQTIDATALVPESTSNLPRYMAIFPYDAQQDDELSFPADAILEILDPENATGWFKARLGDQIGLIPSTYVQSLDAPHQNQ